MNKKQIVQFMANDIAYGIHVGLRKYTDHKSSSIAWKAIGEMADDEAWLPLCEIVANDIYPLIRKEIAKQIKSN